MSKKHFIKIILFCAIFIQGSNICMATDDFSPIIRMKTKVQNQSRKGLSIDLSRGRTNSKNIDLSGDDIFYNVMNATDKFVQSNIRASWNEFRVLIKESSEDDFKSISFANKMADLGFFDLANLASMKIKDKDFARVSIDAMRRFYFPRKRLKLEDELFLAEAYSNILYNNQSSEATSELLKRKVLLSNSDYANYLVALGSYKSSFYSMASRYINIAIIHNPSNLNYKKLKAEIQAEKKGSTEAIKTVENLKKQSLNSYEYERKIKALEQFVLYKTKKAQWEKNYHLGYYYQFENNSSKSIRILKDALSSKKANKGYIYGLMSEVYFSMNEFEKASDTAQKAYRRNKNNPKALLTLGDMSRRDKKYKKALIYYKRASRHDKNNYVPFVKEAQIYEKLSNPKKAREIYTKILKKYSNSYEAYYGMALLDKNKRNIYLKKALAVNPLFEDGWIELARTEIDKGNYNIAIKYLTNSFYIDENDFRYYYYQGIINKNLGEYTQAEYYFKKSLKLNSDFKKAQIALRGLMYIEDNRQLIQDNI